VDDVEVFFETDKVLLVFAGAGERESIVSEEADADFDGDISRPVEKVVNDEFEPLDSSRDFIPDPVVGGAGDCGGGIMDRFKVFGDGSLRS
jgi:hypothetical protein